jgi:hypothetical protein
MNEKYIIMPHIYAELTLRLQGSYIAIGLIRQI